MACEAISPKPCPPAIIYDAIYEVTMQEKGITRSLRIHSQILFGKWGLYAAPVKFG